MVVDTEQLRNYNKFETLPSYFPIRCQETYDQCIAVITFHAFLMSSLTIYKLNMQKTRESYKLHNQKTRA